MSYIRVLSGALSAPVAEKITVIRVARVKPGETLDT